MLVGHYSLNYLTAYHSKTSCLRYQIATNCRARRSPTQEVIGESMRFQLLLAKIGITGGQTS